LRCWGRESSLAAHGEAGFSPVVHGGPPWSRSPPVARGRDLTLEQAPVRTCGPMESGVHARAGLLTELVTQWGTHTGAACS